MLPICLFLGLLFLAGCGQDTKSPASPAQPEGPAYADTTRVSVFADTSLEAAVRTALQKPTGPLTQSDLESLTQLAARNRGIARLAGIDALKNLAVLDLADNQIQDLSPLAVLTSLTHLDLESNRVRDLSALAALRLLQTLNLSFNAIRDLSPLLGLASLKALEVSGNPLTDQSRRQHLPVLQGKGVQVTYAVEPETPEPEGPAALPLLRFAFRAKPANGYRHNIFIGQTNGSTPVNLLPENADFGTPEWSPDGSQLVFVSDREDQLRTSNHIYATNPDGSNLRRLTAEAGHYRSLCWSPDGARIAFTMGGGSTFDPNGARTYLYVMDAGGGNARRLTRPKAQDGDLCWSPDGAEILFCSTRESAGGDFYAMNADGSNVRKLSEGFLYELDSPSWSPDRSMAGFLSTGANSAALYLWDRSSNQVAKIPGDLKAESYGSRIVWAPR